ncbi:MAG: hypothetical protein SGJ27_07895 [Candidatus Melainabacteria bacterium]|nr:hypothetical protein [Candidatus Melainabacteria bacterium]
MEDVYDTYDGPALPPSKRTISFSPPIRMGSPPIDENQSEENPDKVEKLSEPRRLRYTELRFTLPQALFR